MPEIVSAAAAVPMVSTVLIVPPLASCADVNPSARFTEPHFPTHSRPDPGRIV